MVSPDGTRPENSNPEMGRKGLFAVAILIVAVGFVALGSLTSAQPAAIEETTTSSTSTTIGEVLAPIDLENFTVDQLQTGPQLDWEQAAIEGPDGYPIGLFSHDGALYLFATSAPGWQVEPGGMTGWRSTDGTTWESLGQVIEDEYRVSQVALTERGLVALGTPPTGASIVVWISSDGRNWERTELAVETGHPHMRPYPMLVGTNDEALVLAASVGLDTTSLLEGRLAEAGYDIDLDALGWATQYRGAEGHAIVIDAPLGMPGIEIGMEELGLTEQEHQWLVNHTGDSNVDIWANPVGTDDWVPVELEEVDWVESVVTRPDGTMLLTLYTMGAPTSLQSSNGIEWTEVDPGESPQLVHQWAGGLVGIDHRPVPELLISEDGDTWQEAGLAHRFPAQIQWWAGALAGGDDGIAISITGYRENLSAPDREPDREPVEITTDDGHVLTLDLEERVVKLDADGTIHTWEIYRANPPDGIDADIV
ncbi:MAG TPA: hypothetical protein VK969_03215, partial [Acidimicrobiia bacterium]|nr:hypothetical protein [Acidimicrobiia bacterium]